MDLKKVHITHDEDTKSVHSMEVKDGRPSGCGNTFLKCQTNKGGGLLGTRLTEFYCNTFSTWLSCYKLVFHYSTGCCHVCFFDKCLMITAYMRLVLVIYMKWIVIKLKHTCCKYCFYVVFSILLHTVITVVVECLLYKTWMSVSDMTELLIPSAKGVLVLSYSSLVLHAFHVLMCAA